MASGQSNRNGPHTRGKGFRRASGLLGASIRKAGEQRGFATARLLTHWSEIVGSEIGALCRPVSVSHAREGFGATLTILATGANAPMLQMQEPQLRERINAAYGYAAISRIRFTQTAAEGFAEEQRRFAAASPHKRKANPKQRHTAEKLAECVTDDELRLALSRLGTNVLSKHDR